MCWLMFAMRDVADVAIGIFTNTKDGKHTSRGLIDVSIDVDSVIQTIK